MFLVGACATQSHSEKIREIKAGIILELPEKAEEFAATITSKELNDHLQVFATDVFEGRETGTSGQKLAAQFLKRYYQRGGIPSPENEPDYFQEIPSSYFKTEVNDTENVLAIIKGSDLKDEVIVISAHYDHEGVDKKGNVYYGADDNSSGTVALMEMAEAFKIAVDNGFRPRRTILFLHTTAEEIGLHGSRFYTENPLLPLENTVANLNIDMIGRVDPYHENLGNENYLYLIGSDRLSTELHYISEIVNEKFTALDLNYRYNEADDPNRYYFRSDHYNFAKHGIPVIFYFNGEHPDYHKITDTPDKINFELLEKRTKLIFHTAWQIANQNTRLVVDKNE